MYFFATINISVYHTFFSLFLVIFNKNYFKKFIIFFIIEISKRCAERRIQLPFSEDIYIYMNIFLIFTFVLNIHFVT